MASPDPLSFTTIMASSIHDIKNSLNTVLHAVDLLNSECSDSKPIILDCIATIQGEVNLVNTDIIRLLSLYRFDNDQYNLQIDQHILEDFLQAQAAKFSALMKSKQLNLRVELDDTLNAFFDENLLSVVINNAVFNASRYAKSTITLSAHPYEDFICIQVQDDGTGYPAELLENYQARETDIDFATGNTGLGLYFANCVAQQHSNNDKFGYIKLSNASSPQGAVFSVYLP